MQFAETADRAAPHQPGRGASHERNAPAARPSEPSYPHEALVDPSAAGINPRALRRVLDELRAQHSAGLFPGGQIAIRRRGQLVLDEAIGLAEGYRAGEGIVRRASEDTPFPVFSAGKPLIALCIARLEESGRLDVNAPIAETIPEFACRGKEAITTLDVLTHTGGILMPAFCRRWREWSDWNKVVDAMCAVRPSLPRGTLAYHPLEYGWVLSEMVRRVTGRPLPEWLDEHILKPAGLGAMRFTVPPAERAGVARSYWLGGPRVRIGSLNVSELFTELSARPDVVLGSFVPGAGLYTDAAHLAAFYDLLCAGGVTHDGRRVLKPTTIRRYTASHLYSWCRTNHAPLAVGRGFLVGTLGPNVYGWWDSRGCFGHAGAFCTVAFADPATDLSVAIITNANRGPVDLVKRFAGLLGRLRRVARPSQQAIFG